MLVGIAEGHAAGDEFEGAVSGKDTGGEGVAEGGGVDCEGGCHFAEDAE